MDEAPFMSHLEGINKNFSDFRDLKKSQTYSLLPYSTVLSEICISGLEKMLNKELSENKNEPFNVNFIF